MVCHYDILYIIRQQHFSRFLKHVFLVTLLTHVVYWYVLTKYGNMIQILCVLGSHFWIPFLWYVCITYWNNVIAMFHFRLSLLHTFIASELRYVSVQMVSFFDNVRITLNCGNCWNLWILNGSDVIKWSYFGYISF